MNLASLILSTIALPSYVQDAPAKPAQESAATWIADFDAAAKVAKDQHKDLFIDFTGSGWCGWCTKLHEEVFSHDEFLKAAQERFVLVALDFQNTGESKADAPNPTRNNELRDQYEIQGFPTIVIMTPDGDVLGRTGYQEGGATKYAEHVATLHESGKKALVEVAAITKKFETAKDAEKGKVVDEAIEKLAGLPEGSPFGKKLAPIVRAAFTLDADNKAGQKLKAVNALLKAGLVDDDVLAAATALDPKNEAGILERAVLAQCSRVSSQEAIAPALKAIDDLDALGKLKDKEVAIQIYLNAAFWNFRFLNDAAAAKKYAAKAKELGIDNPRALQMIEQILGS